MSVNCPNCGSKLEIPFLRLVKGNRRSKQKSNFQSTQPPVGRIGSFLWFMHGNSWQQIIPSRFIQVHSEIKTSSTQILCNRLTIELTDKQGNELADLYLRSNFDWSRNNTTKYTSLSQSQHNRITQQFLDLSFLNKIHSRKYVLTDGGNRFLRHF